MEKKLVVTLNRIQTVKDFVTATTMSMCDVDVHSGRYLIDGKSIMGIFSMDLSKPVEVIIHGETQQDVDALAARIEEICKA